MRMRIPYTYAYVRVCACVRVCVRVCAFVHICIHDTLCAVHVIYACKFASVYILHYERIVHASHNCTHQLYASYVCINVRMRERTEERHGGAGVLRLRGLDEAVRAGQRLAPAACTRTHAHARDYACMCALCALMRQCATLRKHLACHGCPVPVQSYGQGMRQNMVQAIRRDMKRGTET